MCLRKALSLLFAAVLLIVFLRRRLTAGTGPPLRRITTRDDSHTSERLLDDGAVVFRSESRELSRGPTNGTVLVLTIVKDGQSWGSQRSFHDYLKLISNLGVNKADLSLGLLISDANEHRDIKQILDSSNEDFRRLCIIREPETFRKMEGERRDRHNEDIQRPRRKLLARIRNYLVTTALHDEANVLWIDADMIKIPDNLLPTMIKSGHPILVPSTFIGDLYYDRNTWVGPRTEPTKEQLLRLREGDSAAFIPEQAPGNMYLDQFKDREEDFVPIDAVGGTVLFVKATLHRQGVLFPPYHVIGADWGGEGYDGVETEGLCYVAATIGAACHGMTHFDAIHSAD
ncbi:unnamed protein product [Vitrella brassicaformis CCMP3155]|uniref:Glycosyltransferase family 62 protein n=2 Tax=Vitrella brassicaformis TaxID=1169539 RepID=A0A0G4FGA7_VITBC|nr:unnamed protein product [Vitrella brassicaformis CCMP3155]|eukprot:CEM12201.1 unnamed protein product [Vitrella brassicaformis CCMP3155]